MWTAVQFAQLRRLTARNEVLPASYESAGKHRPAGTRHGQNWLRQALIEAAWGAVRTKNSYYNALYRRVARRRGPNKAIVGRGPLHAQHHLASPLHRSPLPRPSDFFHRLDDPAREAKRLTRRLETLGYTVTITPTAA